MSVNYPIKVKVSPKVLEELYMCEYGRYEDIARAKERGDVAAGEIAFCEFGNRWASMIEIKDDAELRETWYALASGTIGLYHCRAANNVLDKLRAYMEEVDPEMVKRWPHQNGM